jgi:hypothetical protein
MIAVKSPRNFLLWAASPKWKGHEDNALHACHVFFFFFFFPFLFGYGGPILLKNNSSRGNLFDLWQVKINEDTLFFFFLFFFLKFFAQISVPPRIIL